MKMKTPATKEDSTTIEMDTNIDVVTENVIVVEVKVEKDLTIMVVVEEKVIATAATAVIAVTAVTAVIAVTAALVTAVTAPMVKVVEKTTTTHTGINEETRAAAVMGNQAAASCTAS